MAKPKTLVLTGCGINCDEDTKSAFEKAGGLADLVHVNDLIANRRMLNDYQILAFPGGFSYGDDTGAGNALANQIRNNLLDEVRDFLRKDNLAIGICNGFQVLSNLGLLPAFKSNYGERNAALVHNNSARYQCEWVDVQFDTEKSPWLWKVAPKISLPIAHGEGKFYADQSVISELKKQGLVAARYAKGEMFDYYQRTEYNPNGALEDIAGITDESGKVIGMMPHPERAIDFTHLPHWTSIKEKLIRSGKSIPEEGPGLQIFRSGVEYFD